MSKLLRIKQLIEILGVSESTVRRYVNQGLIPKGIKQSPRVTVWKSEDIQKYMDSL